MILSKQNKKPYKSILYVLFIIFFTIFINYPRAQEVSPACKDTRFIEGLNGWLFWNYDFQPTPIFPENLTPYLIRFRQALEQKNIQLVIVPIPNKGMMLEKSDGALSEGQWSNLQPLVEQSRVMYQNSISELTSQGFSIVDLFNATQKNNAEKLLTDHFYYKTDHHWSAYGAKLSAKAVADKISEFVQLVKILPKQDYITQKISSLPFLGSTATAYKTSCKLEWQKEESTRFETALASNSGQDLFKDITPEVVLAGTSFSHSTRDFNFPGFLSNSLQSPVLSYADSAHYLMGWLAAFLTSDDYLNSKPKVLIWEVPSLFWNDFEASKDNSVVWLRHIIPSVYGVCKNNDQVYYSKQKISEKITNYTLFKQLKNYIRGNKYYIHIISSNKKLKKLNFNISYENQENEKINLDFQDRSDNNGNFYLELSDNIRSSLHGLDVTIQNSSGSLITQICRIPNP